MWRKGFEMGAMQHRIPGELAGPADRALSEQAHVLCERVLKERGVHGTARVAESQLRPGTHELVIETSHSLADVVMELVRAALRDVPKPPRGQGLRPSVVITCPKPV